MENIEENSVEQAQETVENAIQEVVEQQEEVKQDPTDQIKQDNLIRMRKKLEAAEDAVKEAERRAQEAERKSQNYDNQSPSSSSPDDDDLSIEDDDYVQAKYVKSNSKKVNQSIQELRQELAVLRAEKATEKMTDFNDVVSNDNLKILQSLYPDDYETMMSNPNLKSKSITAYNMMKNYGISEKKTEIKKAEGFKALDNKIEENKMRPGSMGNARVSKSPLVNASRYDADGRLVLTEADRDRINAEMRRKLGYQ